MDATPMLHRLPAAWRMVHTLPHPTVLRFIVILREPAERAASHFGMLRKLALRGESWAAVYVRDVNASADERLLEEARAFAKCAAGRISGRGGTSTGRRAAEGASLSAPWLSPHQQTFSLRFQLSSDLLSRAVGQCACKDPKPPLPNLSPLSPTWLTS